MGAGEDTQRDAGRVRWLLPFEAACVVFIFGLAAIVGLLSLLRSVPIDLASFAPVGLLTSFLFVVGVTYRATGRSTGISLALVGASLYIGYSNVGVLLNYLLVPVGAATIDLQLISVDRFLGFDWGRVVEAVETRPKVSFGLGLVYSSSLAQIAAAILVLGFTESRVTLHRFLTCGIISSMTCILFWSIVPSIGPSAFVHVPTFAQAVPRVVDSAYARAMLDLLENGPTTLRLGELLGVVAFPSFHTVMMLMSIWYIRGTRFLPVFVIVNIPMLPAIIVHGGHHLVDVIAGMLLFAAAAWVSARLVR